MRKLRLTFFAMVATGIAAVALSGPSSASAPIAASGGLPITSSNETCVTSAHGNVFLHAHDYADSTGTCTGSHVFDATIEGFKDGSVMVHGIATFTGSVTGCGTSTVVFVVTAKIDPFGLVTSAHLQTLPDHGTLPVHASLEPLGFLGTTLAYTGTYSC